MQHKRSFVTLSKVQKKLYLLPQYSAAEQLKISLENLAALYYVRTYVTEYKI